MQAQTNEERTSALASRVRIGRYRLDPQKGALFDGKRQVDIPRLSFRLLQVLADRAPDVVSKDELIAEVWGHVAVSDETLAQRIKLLRQTLGDDSKQPQYIVSVRGEGYRLIADVSGDAAMPPRRVLFAVAAILALTLISVLWWFKPIVTPAGQTIAVLPFEDLSVETDRAYFAAGVHEELVTLLTGVPGVTVYAAPPLAGSQDAATNAQSVAAAVDVDSIVTGSVRIAGTRVRIAVQLVDAESFEQIWANTYEQELTVHNVFDIQRSVASRIAARFDTSATSPPLLQSLPTENLAAYDAYLLGRFYTFQLTPESLDEAIRFLSEAIRLDAEFAEAYTSLGWAYSFQGTLYGMERPREVFPLAKDAALRALAIDPDLSEAHSLYADILTWYDWDFEAAEASYRRAVDLDASDVLGYALYLSVVGRHEDAIALSEQRIARDPLDPFAQVNAGWRYLAAGKYELALRAADRGARHGDAKLLRATAFLTFGDYDEAIDVLTTAIEESGRTFPLQQSLVIAHCLAGHELRAAGARTRFLEMQSEQYVPPSLLAGMAFACSDPDAGFAAAQDAFDERDRGILFLLRSHLLDRYREDARFDALVEAVGLPSSPSRYSKSAR